MTKNLKINKIFKVLTLLLFSLFLVSCKDEEAKNPLKTGDLIKEVDVLESGIDTDLYEDNDVLYYIFINYDLDQYKDQVTLGNDVSFSKYKTDLVTDLNSLIDKINNEGNTVYIVNTQDVKDYVTDDSDYTFVDDVTLNQYSLAVLRVDIENEDFEDKEFIDLISDMSFLKSQEKINEFIK